MVEGRRRTCRPLCRVSVTELACTDARSGARRNSQDGSWCRRRYEEKRRGNSGASGGADLQRTVQSTDSAAGTSGLGIAGSRRGNQPESTGEREARRTSSAKLIEWLVKPADAAKHAALS